MALTRLCPTPTSLTHSEVSAFNYEAKGEGQKTRASLGVVYSRCAQGNWDDDTLKGIWQRTKAKAGRNKGETCLGNSQFVRGQAQTVDYGRPRVMVLCTCRIISLMSMPLKRKEKKNQTRNRHDKEDWYTVWQLLQR